MVPRFKPAIGARELLATAGVRAGAVPAFERAFAEQFGATEGISFAYGRTALFALLKALSLTGGEVIMPAYTCSVVAHAVTLSGNSCRFVDVRLDDYNMDLDQVEAALSDRTVMVLATHLFGFPLDIDRLSDSVRAAERKFGRRIIVIQDCAHAFGVRWKGRLVSSAPDAALFGFNISKVLTSIFGGMMTTNDRELAGRLRAWSASHLREPSRVKPTQRRLYLWAATMAFTAPVYSAVRWLQDETPVLDRLTKAYHRDEDIALPPDFLDRMLPVEAQVGLAQLQRYPEIERARRDHARFYLEHLAVPTDWVLPPMVEGATYSHFPVRVPDRAAVVAAFRRAGVQAGEVIEYSVPHLPGYTARCDPRQFPNAWLCSQHMINLPVHPGLSERDRERVLACAAGLRASTPRMGTAPLSGESGRILR